MHHSSLSRKPPVEAAATTSATLQPTVNFWLHVITYSFQISSAFRAASASVTDTFLNSSRVFIAVGFFKILRTPLNM